jgi:hypothetical protein
MRAHTLDALVARLVTRQQTPRALRHRVFCLIGLRRPIIQPSRDEQELLVRQAQRRCYAAELGVTEGGSAFLLTNTIQPDGQLDLVDPFFPGVPRVVCLHELIARRLLRDAEPTVRFLKVLSWEAPQEVTVDPVDFLFVDAGHSEESVRRDWSAWSRC